MFVKVKLPRELIKRFELFHRNIYKFSLYIYYGKEDIILVLEVRHGYGPQDMESNVIHLTTRNRQL